MSQTNFLHSTEPVKLVRLDEKNRDHFTIVRETGSWRFAIRRRRVGREPMKVTKALTMVAGDSAVIAGERCHNKVRRYLFWFFLLGSYWIIG